MGAIVFYLIMTIILAFLILFQVRLVIRTKLSVRSQLIRQLIPINIGLTVAFGGVLADNLAISLSGFALMIITVMLQYYLRIPLGYSAAYKRLKAGDHHRALEQINKSIESRPNSSEAYYLRSLIHLAQMHLAEAKSDIAKIEELDPHSHLGNNASGQMYYLQGEYAKAKEHYNNSCFGWSTQVCLGQLCYRLEEYDEAVKTLKAAIIGNLPDEQRLLAYYYLGCSLENLNREDEADRVFDDMERWARGLDKLKQVYKPWSMDYPEIQRMQKDIAEIEELVV